MYETFEKEYTTFIISHILHMQMYQYTKILEVNLFAFEYRLFHEDFSSINGAQMYKYEFKF